jgi:hypothetical protein
MRGDARPLQPRNSAKTQKKRMFFSTHRGVPAAGWAGACFAGGCATSLGIGGTYTKVPGAIRKRCADEFHRTPKEIAAVQARFQMAARRRNKPLPALPPPSQRPVAKRAPDGPGHTDEKRAADAAPEISPRNITSGSTSGSWRRETSGARSHPTLPSSASESECSANIVDDGRSVGVQCFPGRGNRAPHANAQYVTAGRHAA